MRESPDGDLNVALGKRPADGIVSIELMDAGDRHKRQRVSMMRAVRRDDSDFASQHFTDQSKTDHALSSSFSPKGDYEDYVERPRRKRNVKAKGKRGRKRNADKDAEAKLQQAAAAHSFSD